MKRFLLTAVTFLALAFAGIPATAQSKLDKLVGAWLLKTDMNGQAVEFRFEVEKTADGVFASLDMPDAPDEKLEIKEADGKFVSVIDVPDYGTQVSLTYTLIDDDTVNVLLDTGSFVMESPMTRIKE